MEVVILAYSSSLTVYTLPNTRYYNSSYLTRVVLFKPAKISLLSFLFSHADNLVGALEI